MTPEEASDLSASIIWSDLCKEIDLKVASLKNQLVVCKPDELVRLQESIKAYNSFKTMPKDIVDRQ